MKNSFSRYFVRSEEVGPKNVLRHVRTNVISTLYVIYAFTLNGT